MIGIDKFLIVVLAILALNQHTEVIMVLTSAGSQLAGIPDTIAQEEIREVVETNPNTIRANIQQRMNNMTRSNSEFLRHIYEAKRLSQEQKDNYAERKKRERATDAEYNDSTPIAKDFRDQVDKKLFGP